MFIPGCPLAPPERVGHRSSRITRRRYRRRPTWRACWIDSNEEGGGGPSRGRLLPGVERFAVRQLAYAQIAYTVPRTPSPTSKKPPSDLESWTSQPLPAGVGAEESSCAGWRLPAASTNLAETPPLRTTLPGGHEADSANTAKAVLSAVSWKGDATTS